MSKSFYKSALVFLLCAVLSVSCGLWGDVEELRPALVGITITSYPEKDSYSIGEYIDLSGLEVRAIYNSGSRMAIENYTYTGFDSNTPGSKTITVEYQAFTAEFTVLVNHSAMILPLTDVSVVIPYLAEFSHSSADDPVLLPMQIDLGMMEQSNSGWGKLLNAIRDADKYVALDLSTCDVITYGSNSEHFDPNNQLTIGKDKIVSLILPEVSKYIEGEFMTETYKGFDNLKFISGVNIETINQFAFYKLESLKEVSFPKATDIRRNAFEKCTSLEKVYLPAAECIEWQAFVDNTSLTEVIIPNIKIMEDDVFSYTGNTNLTIIMGPAAPVVAYGSTFHDIDQPIRTVTVKVPNEAIGYDEDWLFWFKKGNENITLIIRED